VINEHSVLHFLFELHFNKHGTIRFFFFNQNKNKEKNKKIHLKRGRKVMNDRRPGQIAVVIITM
jgi:hypothetical protein